MEINETENITILENQADESQNQIFPVKVYNFYNQIKVDKDLTASKKFKIVPEISKPLRKVLRKKYKRLFPIQHSVISHFINSDKLTAFWPKDIYISAPTGYGKTLAYVIPILQLILNQMNCYGLHTLIVLPHRDLASQVFNVIKELADPLNIPCALLAGFSNLKLEEKKLFREGTYYIKDIVVCTPGRLEDHIRRNHKFTFERLKYVIQDEAELIFKEENIYWYETILRKMKNYIDKPLHFINRVRGQRVLRKIFVSATVPKDYESIRPFNPVLPELFYVDDKDINNEINTDIHAIDLPKTAPEGLVEHYVVIDKEYMRNLFLVDLVKRQKQTNILCFCSTRVLARQLTTFFSNFSELRIDYLGCDLNPKKRNQIIKKMENNELDILFTLDSMSHGMDFDGAVNVVVQYYLAKDINHYINRVGRTARAGRTGIAYSMCSPSQVFHFKKEVQSMNRKITQAKFSKKHCYKYMNAYNKIKEEFNIK